MSQGSGWKAWDWEAIRVWAMIALLCSVVTSLELWWLRWIFSRGAEVSSICRHMEGVDARLGRLERAVLEEVVRCRPEEGDLGQKPDGDGADGVGERLKMDQRERAR